MKLIAPCREMTVPINGDFSSWVPSKMSNENSHNGWTTGNYNEAILYNLTFIMIRRKAPRPLQL